MGQRRIAGHCSWQTGTRAYLRVKLPIPEGKSPRRRPAICARGRAENMHACVEQAADRDDWQAVGGWQGEGNDKQEGQKEWDDGQARGGDRH